MALKKIVIQSIEKEIDNYAKKMEKIIKEEAHVKTGALKDSITIEKESDGSRLIGVDVAKLKSDPRNVGGLDYSIPYYKGHSGYTIRPRKAKALSWVGKDGKRHFAKSVYIPPHAGDPFLKRAVLRRPKL
ncbi:hypothetical protein FEW48_002541 [Enterococcus faecalis]|uniref:hypothetical protein n=1 Tax=Enterococcus faecalis TaxID=1351 RepID=UPI0001F0B658|nr:hypothetical protein [Enterococcus faecalis]DAU70170.1 MAG TPA: putative tail-component [Caudoviricetes sp.]EFT46599.1 hypothetical protein HMPREF9501_02555 [Enterococcus faecalis TX0027]EGO2631682.1 hypothetical protein [Enterococcus faecalis]EGO7881641.1 hypothetical protein [Enterococcus faecalis]EGO7994684.1 hypothetical protein [Enterococcus faecalis]